MCGREVALCGLRKYLQQITFGISKEGRMKKNRIITVQDIPVTITQTELEDYICITDIAAAKSENSRAADIVRNWLRNRTTLEFLSTWEEIYKM